MFGAMRSIRLPSLFVIAIAAAWSMSGCALLPLVFGTQGGSTTVSGGAEPLPADAFAGGGFVRCAAEQVTNGTPAAAPPDIVELHGPGERGAADFGDIVVRFSIVGSSSKPELFVETEIQSTHGASESSGSTTTGGPWHVGPVTVSADGGRAVTYSCELAGP